MTDRCVTDPTPYTDDDVEALATKFHDYNGLKPRSACVALARQLFEDGYRLSPTEPAPQDDGPAEPLFTGIVEGRRSLMGMKHLDWVQITPAYREDFPFDRLDIDDLVDVFPHGQRPAAPAQAVTAEMVYEAIEAAEIRGGLNPGYGPMYVRPCDWTRAEAATVADALNRLLAEREAENERGGSDG